MGYVSIIGSCFACGRLFSFSPTKVPSIVVEGRREPLCEACVVRANELRAANGQPLIVPLPGAYDADDEAEVPWPDD
jgi:hypothetical protein